MRFILALFTAKLAQFALRLMRRNATYLPGKLAIRLCPDFLGRIGKPETIIGVTGTNGKTTVCNFIIDVLKREGEDVLSNRLGSNINAGLASALISGSGALGRCKKKIGVFEIDERSSKLIYPYIKPDYLVCTNLFRDSIRRNAHAEYIADILSSSIPKSSKLILNGDDLIASHVAPENERVYFGIERLPTDVDECVNIINDRRVCPECAARLRFEFVRYHHIGRAACPACGYGSPNIDYTVENIDLEASAMTVREGEERAEYSLVNSSIFNIYNMAAAVTLLRQLGYSHEALCRDFSEIKIVESRYSKVKAGGITVITNMAKGQNPIACSRVFEYVKNEPGDKQVILILDDVFDAKDSSENITWLYDCDFEFLNDPAIKRIAIGGIRAEDYYLRLLLAGVEEEKLAYTRRETDTSELLDYSAGGAVYILHELYAADTAFSVRDRVLKLAGDAG